MKERLASDQVMFAFILYYFKEAGFECTTSNINKYCWLQWSNANLRKDQIVGWWSELVFLWNQTCPINCEPHSQQRIGSNFFHATAIIVIIVQSSQLFLWYGTKRWYYVLQGATIMLHFWSFKFFSLSTSLSYSDSIFTYSAIDAISHGQSLHTAMYARMSLLSGFFF